MGETVTPRPHGPNARDFRHVPGPACEGPRRYRGECRGSSGHNLARCPPTSITRLRRRCGPRRSPRCSRFSRTIPGTRPVPMPRRVRPRPRSKRRARSWPRCVVRSPARSCSRAAAARATTSRSRARRGRATARLRRRRHERHRAQGGAGRGEAPRPRRVPCHDRARGDRRRRRPRRARRCARRANGRRVGHARQQRDRRRPAARHDRGTRIRDTAPHAVFHTDAVQAPQWVDLRSACAEVQLIAISGHKFGGPKGVGALVVRDGTTIVPLVEGGGHERDLRAGHPERCRASSRSRRALATDRRAPRRGDRAHRGAARPARSRAARPGLGRDRQWRSGPARRRSAALLVRRASKPRRCSSRSTSRDLRGVGLGLQFGRDRPVARVARDGHAARAGAVVGALLVGVRVDVGRHRRGVARSFPKSSRSCARHDARSW